MTDRCAFENPSIVNPTLSSEQLQSILYVQSEMLQQAVIRRDYINILDELCALAESFTSNAVASVMLFDEARETLYVASAPSLNQIARDAFNGLRPGEGSCGNAVFHNEPMYVSNTLEDARWRPLAQVAREFNLCSCFSFPIRDTTGDSIGSFAISSFEHRTPDGFHQSLLQTCTNICSVILQRKRDEELRARALEAQVRRERIESLGVLAGGIAHDFNNLLTAVMGSVDLAVYSMPDSSEKDGLELSMKAITRAKELAGRLQTLSKGDPVLQAANVEAIIRDSCEFALQGSNVAFEFTRLTDATPILDVDTGQIGQLVQNLVLNARLAMPQGGTVTIECERVHETSRETLAPGPYLKITVTDSGVGIPEPVLEHVFEPYFTTRAEGHGLGLFLCYSIVENHGGAIFLDSKCDVGTTVSVYLPWRPTKQSVAPVPKTPPVVGGTGTILIMDDEEIVRQTLRRILEILGYQVLEARNGEEAISLFAESMESQPILAAILDLTVPGGLGGIETRNRIRAMCPDARVLVSSGYSAENASADREAGGFDGVIAKPYTVSDVTSALAEATRRR